MGLHYTRRHDGDSILPCIVRQAALDYLAEEGHTILVGIGTGGENTDKALVEPEMIYGDEEQGEDPEEEKGLVWNIFSVNTHDPQDIRDGLFYSSEGSPEEALKVAEEWALAH